MTSLSAAIRQVMLTGEARAKVMATRALVRAWRQGTLLADFAMEMPGRPTWPGSLEFLSAGRMPKRRGGGSQAKSIALWHSIAHIEFVAIDLALDMAGRFGGGMGRLFVDDFLSVAADEAIHFALVDRRLRALGSHYGALPVHDGLWEAAESTRHDVAARLAVVPMVLEARGLDVTPATLDRVRAAGDESGGRILQRILDDEIRHVGVGTKHFVAHCMHEGFNPQNHWKALVKRHFTGRLSHRLTTQRVLQPVYRGIFTPLLRD